MSVIRLILEEIEEQPRSKVCRTCLGKQKIQSSAWQQFFRKYGENSLDIDTNFYIAKNAWLEAKSPPFDESIIIFMDVGLTHSESEDFYKYYLTHSAVEDCKNCENGRELTEHGELVAQLRNAINKL